MFRIAFPDSTDIRTIKAALELEKTGEILPILIGERAEIKHVLADNSLELPQTIKIISPSLSAKSVDYSEEFFSMRKAKGVTFKQAHDTMKNPLYYAGMALRKSDCDAVIAGSQSTTGNVIKAALQTVGTKKGIQTVSSFFLMIFPDKTLAYADCGVVPNPTDEQLCDIALSTASNYELLTGEKPKVALLSFSTHGSAEHDSIDKIRSATKILASKSPDFLFDGELQFDAAFVPEIAARKSPTSPLAGSANVFIFPDLHSGNIAYKITERLAGAQAIGPILQGLAKPYLDLSRGCSYTDIVKSAYISQKLSQ